MYMTSAASSAAKWSNNEPKNRVWRCAPVGSSRGNAPGARWEICAKRQKLLIFFYWEMLISHSPYTLDEITVAVFIGHGNKNLYKNNK